MKTLFKFMAVGALALGPALSAGAAHAISPNYTEAAISKLNWDGFKTCKALGDSGYTAITRGTHSAGSSGPEGRGDSRFDIRTCFKTASACERHVNRIHHKVGNIEQLWLNRCYPRG